MAPPSSIVATMGIRAAAVTADNHAALPVSSRTPKASARGDMKLPAREIERPAKNHRKAGERQGPSPPRGDPAAPSGVAESAVLEASDSGTRSHAARDSQIPQRPW